MDFSYPFQLARSWIKNGEDVRFFRVLENGRHFVVAGIELDVLEYWRFGFDDLLEVE